eukprot:scpid15556/ scgid14646/ 
MRGIHAAASHFLHLSEVQFHQASNILQDTCNDPIILQLRIPSFGHAILVHASACLATLATAQPYERTNPVFLVSSCTLSSFETPIHSNEMPLPRKIQKARLTK